MTYDQVWWSILGICALHLTHPRCTHIAVNTYTVNTHTRSSGQLFMRQRPGSSLWFGALLKGTSVVVSRVERVLYIHSPHLQFLPARDSNWQPFDYESDSLIIRPWLPHIISRTYTVSHRSEYTPYIFVNNLLYIFMWQHWKMTLCSNVK